MDKIDAIVIHCSATRRGQDFTADDIDRWHREQGFAMIGYNYVVRIDGTVETGRPLTMDGAHCSLAGHSGLSYNRHSVGICYVGGLDDHGNAADTRTDDQKRAMEVLIAKLVARYPVKEIIGHRDASPDINADGIVDSRDWIKSCPCFDARAEYGHLLDEAEERRDDAQ